jgi:hypothetical protein
VPRVKGRGEQSMKDKTIISTVKKILNHCENKKYTCDCPLASVKDGSCLFRNDEFPKGIDDKTRTEYPDIFFNRAQAEILKVLHKYLDKSSITLKSGAYTKRHSAAIETLKTKGIIAKDKDNILYIK